MPMRVDPCGNLVHPDDPDYKDCRPIPRVVDGAVNAVREVLALKKATADDGKDRVSSISYAQARKVEAFRKLTGGQLGMVRRILAAHGITI